MTRASNAVLEYWQVISEQWPDAEVIQVVIYALDSPLKMANGIKRGRLASWKHLSAKDIRNKLANLSVLSQLRKHDTPVKEKSAILPIEINIRENAFVKWGEEINEARGEAKLLTKILERRSGPLPEDLRPRI